MDASCLGLPQKLSCTQTTGGTGPTESSTPIESRFNLLLADQIGGHGFGAIGHLVPGPPEEEPLAPDEIADDEEVDEQGKRLFLLVPNLLAEVEPQELLHLPGPVSSCLGVDNR